MPTLRAGDLNQRIAIFQRAEASRNNPFNEVVYGAPRKVVDAWSEVFDIGSAEVVKARQVAAECSMVMSIRWRSELDRMVNLLVLYRTRVLEVIGVPMDPDGMREQFQLVCKEVAPPAGLEVAGSQAMAGGGITPEAKDIR